MNLKTRTVFEGTCSNCRKSLEKNIIVITLTVSTVSTNGQIQSDPHGQYVLCITCGNDIKYQITSNNSQDR